METSFAQWSNTTSETSHGEESGEFGSRKFLTADGGEVGWVAGRVWHHGRMTEAKGRGGDAGEPGPGEWEDGE
jgi:hypothetical protein